jgi:hypothetical protein
MNQSQFVAKLCGKEGISGVSRGEMERMICAQYSAVEGLLVELYCESGGKHKRFDSMTPEQRGAYEKVRVSRLSRFDRMVHGILQKTQKG